MLFVPVFDKASKPDRTSLQPHPSPTKNRHAPQQTGLRPDHCATQPHSTLFVSNQQVGIPRCAEMCCRPAALHANHVKKPSFRTPNSAFVENVCGPHSLSRPALNQTCLARTSTERPRLPFLVALLPQNVVGGLLRAVRA